MSLDELIAEAASGNAVLLFLAAFIIICIFLGVRIVPQSEKYVVERFGRLNRCLGRGSILSCRLSMWCAIR